MFTGQTQHTTTIAIDPNTRVNFMKRYVIKVLQLFFPRWISYWYFTFFQAYDSDLREFSCTRKWCFRFSNFCETGECTCCSSICLIYVLNKIRFYWRVLLWINKEQSSNFLIQALWCAWARRRFSPFWGRRGLPSSVCLQELLAPLVRWFVIVLSLCWQKKYALVVQLWCLWLSFTNQQLTIYVSFL